MMPGFRHRNRPTSLPKLRQRPLLRHPQGHHPGGHRGVLCTLHFRVPSPGFPGGGSNLGGGVLLPLHGRGRLRRLHRERHRIRRQRRHLHAAGVFPPRHRRRQQLHVGGEFVPCLHRERRRRGHLGYLCAGRVFFPRFHRHGHRRRRQLHVGGGHSYHVFIGSGGYVGGCGDIFPPRGYSRRGSSGGGDRWHTCKRERSRTAGGSGCVASPPASDPSVGAGAATGELLATEQEQEQLTGGIHVSGSEVGPPAAVGASPTPPASDPCVRAGRTTGELLATEQEQEQLVASGGRREVLAEVSRMAGGTSPVGLGALPAASNAPPGSLPTSEERWAGMVHDGGAGGRWQGQRVMPAVTRSRRSVMGYGRECLLSWPLKKTSCDLSPSCPHRTLLSKNCHRSWSATWRRRRRTFRHTLALIAASGRRRRVRD